MLECNVVKRLNVLGGPPHYERICKISTEQPKRFRKGPAHHMTELNIYLPLRSPSLLDYGTMANGTWGAALLIIQLNAR